MAVPPRRILLNSSELTSAGVDKLDRTAAFS